jgi:hypothetical protein
MHDAGNTMQWLADNFISSGSPDEDVFAEINRLAAETDPQAPRACFSSRCSEESVARIITPMQKV